MYKVSISVLKEIKQSLIKSNEAIKQCTLLDHFLLNNAIKDNNKSIKLLKDNYYV